MTIEHRSPSPKFSLLVPIFFSLLPISTTIFAICVIGGALLIGLPLSDLRFIQAGFGFLILILFLGWIVTPLAYRFLARAFPLEASGRPNHSALRTLRIALAVMSTICLGLVLSCWYFYTGIVDRHGLDLINFAIASAMSNIMLLICSIILLSTMSLTYGLVRILALHRRPAAWTSQRFLLFLRSFGSVSDSAAAGALVKAAGARMRVALLSSPRSIKASWNPLTLAMAGFSFRRPFRSVPLYLESTDETWSDDVKRMADSAQVIVIDITHHSPGLVHEIDMLAGPGLTGKTVRFVEFLGEDAAGTQVRSESVITLERSPALRRWSQVLGFTFTYIGFVVMSAFVVSIFDIKWSSMPATIVLWSSLAYSLVPAIWGAAELSPAGGFTRRSTNAFVEAIAQKAGRPTR